MANLAERLNAISQTREQKEQEVTNDILKFFSDKIMSGEFEERLFYWINQSEKAKSNRTYELEVEFWDYHSGCSNTHFSNGVFIWYSNGVNSGGWESRTYKGIELYNVQQKVGSRLVILTSEALRDMGLSVVVEDNTQPIGYFNKKLTIRW